MTYFGKGRMPVSLSKFNLEICILTIINMFTLHVLELKISVFCGILQGFGEKCTPRGQCTFGARLQDEEIKLLAEFVKLQADQNWPNILIEEK